MSLAQKVAILAAGSVVGSQAGLTASSLNATSGYTGSLTVTGHVKVGQVQNNQVNMWYHLEGADADCDGTQTGANCGIHIHAGTSCEATGGLHPAGAATAWTGVHYYVSGGKAVGMNVIVNSGSTLAENTGKVVQVHDSAGTVIACDVLEADEMVAGTKEMEASAFSKYPDYTGTLAVAGDVHLKQTDATSVVLEYTLTGVDPLCTTVGSMTATNACGIHVHKGPCSAAQGHHFVGATDPWSKIVYIAKADGTTGATVSTEIPMGATAADTAGRSIVVHDLTGARVACAEIKEHKHNGPVVTNGVPRAVGGLVGFAAMLLSFVQ